ncbi:ferredoxin [Planomonospora parontospora]|uniref:ferredoxin n=1 Tax=Planomonospora parontospora TaxID=58119 RepID=UPI0016712E53|nr:ferredoxin [Planomonospora parontospora]GGL54856.1 hypothetical protein GCM10014719_65190 [Planomonospora parontospora subsp. antibiotica]GII19282.1 hypothetical protein Ppa05_60080 [Planomonospora parontospora subsp. antibiotica]
MVNEHPPTSYQRIAIDPARCIGAGTCAALAPHVFRAHADGTQVLTPQAPAENAITDAADCCPVQAITLTGHAADAALLPRDPA